MKKLLALSAVILLILSVSAYSQGGPNAGMGASSGGYTPMAKAQSDNEALRRMLYALWNPPLQPVNVTPTPQAIVNITNPSITNVSTVALASNVSRKWAELQNPSGADCFCSEGGATPTTTTYGFKLFATGGFYIIDSTNLTTGAVNCITSSGTSVIAVNEHQ